MSIEEVKKRFLEEIKLRAFDDQYIDRTEEKEVLRKAVEMGVTVDSARAALGQVCESEGFVLESMVYDRIRDMIDTFAGNDGKVDEKEFTDTVTTTVKACKGKKSELECKRMVLEVMDKGSQKVKTGMFSNWYARVKKEVGMA